MKIIVAMKEIKELSRKADDIRDKVSKNCALLDYETPVYGQDQRKTIDGWLQSYSDILKRIEFLRLAIQKTNLATEVEIEIGGNVVKKTIAAWIHRRKDLAKAEAALWRTLNDRGLKESKIKSSVPGQPDTEVKIVRYFDPVRRDDMVNIFAGEPTMIDSRLEVVNAVTDLVE